MKDHYNDNKFYSYIGNQYNNGKDNYEDDSYEVYSVPLLDNYFYKNYEERFYLAKNDSNFIWFSSQQQKLNEAEFNQTKTAIQELENNKNPSRSEIYKKIDLLESDILLNQYQFFTYPEYLKACEVLLEVDGDSMRKDIIYNPPLDENKFLNEKQRILKSMIDKGDFSPSCLIEGNTIFPFPFV